MAKYVIGAGRLFKVGDKVYYRTPASRDVIGPDGTPRFPDGFAEVTCVISEIVEEYNSITGEKNLNYSHDTCYVLLVTRRTLAFKRGDKIPTSGNHFGRRRTVGNGKKRAPRKIEMSSEDRRLAMKALLAVPVTDSATHQARMRALHELNR